MTFSGVAQAALVLDASGNAVGVTNVEVNGVLYDVTFNVGSYNEVFGAEIDPDPLPTFGGGDSAASFEALQGITSQLNIGNVGLVADGLSGSTADSVIVPYDHTATRFLGNWTGQDPPLPWGNAGLIAHTRIATTGLGRTYSFARFEEQSTVPEPSTAVLIGFGLLAAGAIIRNRRN